MKQRIRPLSELRDPRRIRGLLLFDIDETLATEGKLTAQAYGAMEQLKRAAGLSARISSIHVARLFGDH